MIALRAIVLVAAFCITAAAMFPMRVAWAAAGAQPGLSVDAMSGTIWAGRLSGVAWRGVALGDFTATSSLLDSVGSLVVHLKSDGGPVETASLTTSAGKLVIDNLHGAVELSRFLPGAPTAAALRVSEGELEFEGFACRSAAARLSTAALVDHGIPAFEGALECRNGRLTADLASADAVHQLSVMIDPSAAKPALEVLRASAATTLWLAALGITVSPQESSP